MNQHVIPVKTNLIVFGVLMLLLAVTVGAAYMDLGWFDVPIAMTIAVSKMILIMLYFMHLRYGTKLIGLIASAGFLWLAIMIAFILADVFSRDWLRTPDLVGTEYFGPPIPGEGPYMGLTVDE